MTTQTLTLSAFLEARITEREAMARRYYPHWRDGDGLYEVCTGIGADDEGADDSPTDIAISPARLLAECAAHRRIVEWCSERERVWIGPEWGTGGDAARESDFVPGAIAHPADSVVLRILASVYSDHPDYREEWRP